MLSNISRLLLQCSTRRLTNFSTKVEPFITKSTGFTSIRSIQTTTNYSQQQQDSRVVDGLSHEELEQKLQDKDNIYLVDVRRSEEVSEGRIPGDKWVHIPWQDVEEATTLNNDEFLSRYGQNKPAKDEVIVFYCLAGVRSTLALKAHERSDCDCEATHYPGGWDSWVQHNS